MKEETEKMISIMCDYHNWQGQKKDKCEKYLRSCLPMLKEKLNLARMSNCLDLLDTSEIEILPPEKEKMNQYLEKMYKTEEPIHDIDLVFLKKKMHTVNYDIKKSQKKRIEILGYHYNFI